MTSAKRGRLHLVDGSGLIFRAHFAFLRRPLTTARGTPVGAVFGFLTTLLALIREEEATHLAVAFDTEKPTFRHERYPEYKAHRPPVPPELIEQFPLVHRLVDALGVAHLEQDGVEADDLIGSLARSAEAEGWEVVIVSADKDFAQLIAPRIRMYVPARGREAARWVDTEAVEEKWGVKPEQFIDFLALTGDASDNIPGVTGVGPKTAASLLQAHGSLDAILGDLDAIASAAVRKKLERDRERALLSRELVTIRTDLLPFDPSTYPVPDPSARDEFRAFLEEMEFRRLVERWFPDPSAGARQGSLLDSPPGEVDAAVAVADSWDSSYQRVNDADQLARIVRRFPGGETPLAIDTETTGLDPLECGLVGLSFAWTPGEAWYVPIAHEEGGNLARGEVEHLLGPLLADGALVKAGQNLKFDAHVLRRHGLALGGPLRDTMVASYVRDPGARHGLDPLAREFLDHEMVPIERLIGTGKDQLSMAEVPAEKVTPYACEDVDAVVRLLPLLRRQLETIRAWRLFTEVEMPLLPVLVAMEASGITLDRKILDGMAGTLAGEMERQEAEIHRLAEEDFNVNSPKQLQRILFEKLKLKPRRRTKTGFSTGQEVLEELATEHPLPARILEYRQVAKLRSTYVEALPRLVRGETDRIHATFHQTVAATGRLSSSNPNLQNIPIRAPQGREIRRAFKAARGMRLVSADYSQIELRILAHLSEDPNLVEAFRQGADIHRATAARVFGVEEEAVDAEMRGRAKVVNFGVLYGMGPQRLAREQGIAVAEASAFIAEYFDKLPGVKAFIDRAIEEARSRGYAETLLGRRRYLPDLQSTRHQARSAAERMAVNTPVQGSAADLIKVAMVRVQALLESAFPAAHLLIQVHDELILEVPEAQTKALEQALEREMTSVLELRVPLRVETGAGKDWYEAHA